MSSDVTIFDIAAYTNVSVSTVSRTLNKHPDVSPKTREKVLEAIQKLGYIPNDSARNLKRESMKAIGVIVKGFSNPFFTSILTVIQKELDDKNYLMLLRQVDPKENELDAAIALTKEKKPRGLIFLGGNFDQQEEKFAQINIPFVLVTIDLKHGVERTKYSSVAVDDYIEGYNVTKKIIEAGHTDIAAIGYMEDDKSISRLRIDGFLAAAKDHGLSPRAIEYAGEFSFSAGYEAAKKLVSSQKLSCLFCISDILALGAMRAIHDEGYSIPNDISVIGFDGIEQGRYSIPSLATVKQPDLEMAYKSVQLMMNYLQKKSQYQHLTFKAEFVDGESFAVRRHNSNQ